MEKKSSLATLVQWLRVEHPISFYPRVLRTRILASGGAPGYCRLSPRGNRSPGLRGSKHREASDSFLRSYSVSLCLNFFHCSCNSRSPDRDSSGTKPPPNTELKAFPGKARPIVIHCTRIWNKPAPQAGNKRPHGLPGRFRATSLILPPSTHARAQATKRSHSWTHRPRLVS
jgi:hypothetical protein